jgi:predicted dehydrogenase
VSLVAEKARKLRWGLIGASNIARSYMKPAIDNQPHSTVAAVASADPDWAETFARENGIPRVHQSVSDLIDDPDIDVVYISTTNELHCAQTIAAARAGKHVLCEKPLALNRAQATRMADAARSAGLFLMEAIWSRFLPSYRTLVSLLEEERIGDPLLVEADFGFRRPIEPTHRLFDPALGGGALLDLGIYPLQLASLVLGPPDQVTALGHLGSTGVDEQVAAVLHHPGGTLAVVKAAIRTPLACTGRIAGTRGAIELPAFMHCPEAVSVQVLGQTERIECPMDGDGLRYEIDEVHRCLSAGLTESPSMPLDESVTLAGTLDTLRAQVGVRYAADDVGVVP